VEVEAIENNLVRKLASMYVGRGDEVITMNIREVTEAILQVIGLLTVLYVLFRTLAHFIDSVDLLYNKLKVKFYYPIASRISKRSHKKYIETYFNKLLFREPIELPLSFGQVKIEWSDEESVQVDLEENVLLVRIKYAEELERILAKTAFLAAPYLVSGHLEPALGRELSRLVSIGIIEGYLHAYPNILKEFRQLVEEVYGGKADYKEIISLITRADDTSLYKHVFLYELRKILERFGSRVDRDTLANELKELLRIVAYLEEVNAPKVCGYYINVTIVRAGRLEKVALGQWEGYVEYIRNVQRECAKLQRVYVVSAGRYTTMAVEKLIDYLKEKVPGLELLDTFRYKARYYKGMTSVPSLVVVMEFR
jgi:hypothetical protein